MSENRLLLDVEDESKSVEYYEFGLPYDYKAVKFRLFRDPVIQFLCKGLPEEALSDVNIPCLTCSCMKSPI